MLREYNPLHFYPRLADAETRIQADANPFSPRTSISAAQKEALLALWETACTRTPGKTGEVAYREFDAAGRAFLEMNPATAAELPAIPRPPEGNREEDHAEENARRGIKRGAYKPRADTSSFARGWDKRANQGALYRTEITSVGQIGAFGKVWQDFLNAHKVGQSVLGEIFTTFRMNIAEDPAAIGAVTGGAAGVMHNRLWTKNSLPMHFRSIQKHPDRFFEACTAHDVVVNNAWKEKLLTSLEQAYAAGKTPPQREDKGGVQER